MPRLYHPNLGVETDVPDDDVASVLAESGWLPAPEPEPPEPGRVAEPIVYAPVTSSKSKPKASKSTEPADAGAQGDDH